MSGSGTVRSASILLVVFNRPEETSRALDHLRVVEPDQVFVVGDGPRPDRPEERERCREVRAIIEDFDWNSPARTWFRSTNVGCGRNVSEAISWAFDAVPELIILEDDCLANPSFFRYATELLERYRDDDRIMHINGNNYGARLEFGGPSYGFTHFPQAWGWATWRSAWAQFDLSLSEWSAFRDRGLMRALPLHPRNRHRQAQRWDSVAERLHTWDFQWHFAVMTQGGLAVAPSRNLVSNIGFGDTATHTDHPRSREAHLPTEELDFPLDHPEFVIVDPDVDRHYEYRMLGHPWSTRRLLGDAARAIGLR